MRERVRDTIERIVLVTAAGDTTEWASAAVPRYQRRTAGSTR